MNKIQVFNTLSGTKEEFVPLQDNVVRMYACGPTVYDRAHLGNARPVVVFDVPLLAEHFMVEFAREYGRRGKRFDQGALSMLQHYPWPGNVRELRNVIERLVIMVPGDIITADDLAFLGHGSAPPSPADAAVAGRLTLHEARERFERDLILRTLAEQQGNMSRTADAQAMEET